MRLIVMAHSGEAQAFFKEYKLTEQTELMSHLYRGEDFYLLICGEGRQLTTQRLAFCLGALAGKVSEVINLGIAATLSEHVDIDSIVSVRTCYQEGLDGNQEGKMEFKSFTSNNPNANLDLVTSHQRVLNKDYAETLSHFASIADREAWAIGSVCQSFQTSWQCYKYISDRAGIEKEVCERLKEQAYQYSHALLEFYQQEITNEILSLEQHEEKHDLPFDLYLTKTQSRQLKSLMEKLTIKFGSMEAILDKFDYLSIIESPLRPKEKSKQFIEELKALLNPFNKIINEKIDEALKPLKKQGVRCHLDPSLEQKSVQISASISSSKDIYKLQDALNQFEYKKIDDLFEGEFDV